MKLLLSAIMLIIPLTLQAQIDEGQLGAWYNYAFSHQFSDSELGIQGVVQHRNWDTGGDLQQLLVLTGLSWKPTDSPVSYAAGIMHIRSGAFGRSAADTEEIRLYEDAFISQRWAEKFYILHRFRLEQRWGEQQRQRNRLRYFLGANRPLNRTDLNTGAIYLSLYNEIFFNLEQNIGYGRSVDYFDRIRSYAGIGYSLRNRSRIQFGYMYQRTDNSGKGQLQLNLFQTF